MITFIEGTYCASKQISIGVKGNFTCNGKPYNNVTIKLYDYDPWWSFYYTMDSNVPVNDSRFDKYFVYFIYYYYYPYLQFYHTCSRTGGISSSKRTFYKYIPSKCIVCGKSSMQQCDFGRMELNGTSHRAYISILGR